MNTSKLALSLFALLLVPGLYACDDGSGGRDPDELGEGETDGGTESGVGTTGISGTTGIDPSGSSGEPDPTGEGESTGEVGSTGSTGEVGSTGGEEDTGTTGGLEEAPEDGDHENEPAVFAQFRATAAAPVSVDEPLFNEDPIDVQGLLYSNAVSVPGDDLDVVQFRIVPGEVDPTIVFALDCDLGSEPLVRASLYDDSGDLVDSVTCGQGPQNVLLQDASSADLYRVDIEAVGEEPLLANYSMTLDAFCFQDCDFQPYAG